MHEQPGPTEAADAAITVEWQEIDIEAWISELDVQPSTDQALAEKTLPVDVEPIEEPPVAEPPALSSADDDTAGDRETVMPTAERAPLEAALGRPWMWPPLQGVTVESENVRLW